MRHRAWASRGNPFVVRRERRLDLRVFPGLRRRVPLHCPQPPQLCQRDNRSGLAAKVDHLIRPGWIGTAGCLCGLSPRYRDLRFTSLGHATRP